MKIALLLLLVGLAFGQISAGPTTKRPVLTCATILCISGYGCKDGKCIKNSEFPPGISCANVKCKSGTRCVEPGRCVRDDRCDTVKCSAGHVCVQGRCEKIYVNPIRTTPARPEA